MLGEAARAARSAPMRCGQGDPIEDLGGGGYAGWAADDAGSLDETMTSPLATVVIHGRDSEDMVATVKATASIGSIRVAVCEKAFLVPAKSDLAFPIDLTPALGMHDDQFNCPTVIRAVVNVTEIDGYKIGGSQVLEGRYLVLRKNLDSSGIHDRGSFRMTYPYGVTREEETERMLAMLTPKELAEQGGVVLSSATAPKRTPLDEEMARRYGEGR